MSHEELGQRLQIVMMMTIMMIMIMNIIIIIIVFTVNKDYKSA